MGKTNEFLGWLMRLSVMGLMTLLVAAAPATQPWGPAVMVANLHRDIEYAKVGNESLKLDAYVPKGNGPFPMAIIVHGGGWSGGDKTRDISVLFKPLSDANFVWFSINYRLSPKHQWPACFDDTRTAIRWVKSHAREFHGDPGRIALIGYSAGGEMTCLSVALNDPSTHVNAAVGISPPTDMVADTVRRGGLSPSAKALLGVTAFDGKARAVLGEMSALNYVKPGLPPFLLVHGNMDKSVPYSQSVAFQAKLKAAGVPCELITIDKGPHDITKWDALAPTYKEQMIAWLKSTLGD
jgi:alpha-L-fucosidase 2